VDAVHGHNNLHGAVIFPHNIGLGAAGDPDLVQRIGRATAEEMAATGVRWNFAPTVAVPQDLRWGRTYEGYGQDSDLVSRLGSAYVRGPAGGEIERPAGGAGEPQALPGGRRYHLGHSRMLFPIPPGFGFEGENNLFPFKIDQGTRLDEAALREVHLAPYRAALSAGAQIVMASFSSWNGVKMHAHHYLLTEVLKGELGFEGFIVSDWAGIDQVAEDYYQAVVMAINAGIDMSMVPQTYERFITTLRQAVEAGDVPIGCGLALQPQPDHPARPDPLLEQHLQQRGRPVREWLSPACSAATTSGVHEAAQRPQQRRRSTGRSTPSRSGSSGRTCRRWRFRLRLRPARLPGSRTATTSRGATATTGRRSAWPGPRLQDVPPARERLLPYNRNGVLFPRRSAAST
jgi:hypothetical protein